MKNEITQNKQDIIKNTNKYNYTRAKTVLSKTSKDQHKKTYNYCKSKWANLKYILQDLESLESSVKLLKAKTIGQFFFKCRIIYKTKIEIYLLTKQNNKILINLNEDSQDTHQRINVKDDLSDFPTELIKDFMFLFREDNNLMYKIIESSDRAQVEILVPFLCHLFYENFFMENSEQEEMLYIIYLLLEKEIDVLVTPSLLSFLNNSFLSKFFDEFRDRYEIKSFNITILNNLIRDINELNLSFYSLDIISTSKNKIKKFNKKNSKKNLKCIDMNLEYLEYETDNFNKNKYSKNLTSRFTENNYTNQRKKRNSATVNLNKILQLNSKKNYGNNIIFENKAFKNKVNKNFFNDINENFIKKSFEKEKNEIMKQYYMEKLKTIYKFNDPNLYNSHQYYDELKKKEVITTKSIEKYNKGVELIQNFIDKLLTNLENTSIIPYSIKVICKIIFILIKKKFKRIPLMKRNLFICKFLFDKIILPVLLNPDMNIICKDEIITLNTRKNLSNIYSVLKMFIRGDMFTSQENRYMTIFNQFFIDNYLRLNNLLLKIINVKLPEKLEYLSEEFYCDDNFVLNNDLRYFDEINYDYFMENYNDFMQYESICFNTKHFFIFYDIVKKNPEKFFGKGSEGEKIFNTISTFINMIKTNQDVYYVIINEKYNTEVEELLFPKKTKIMLGIKNNKSNILKNIKYCITHLLNNLKINSHWDWTNNAEFKTINILSFINKYLNASEKNMEILKNDPPLNWYSSYILKNIDLIGTRYSNNDYQKLYEEILNDTLQRIDNLKKINEFLTVNITTKFNLINNRMKIFRKELQNIKNIELTLQATKFMKLKKIKTCLIDEKEFNNIKKNIPKEIILPQWSSMNNQNLLLTWQKDCPHSFLDPEEYVKLEKNGYLSNFHFNTIEEFSKKFKGFHKKIIDEIINRSLGLEFQQMEYNLKNHNNKNKGKKYLNENNIVIEITPKKILEQYILLVSSKFNINKFVYINSDEKIKFSETNEIGFEIIENPEQEEYTSKESAIDKLRKKNEERKLKIFRNYILKVLCIDIYEDQPLIIDKTFFLKCVSFSWILPKNLEIPNEICNEKLFDKIRYHIKRMDKLRTPENMLEEFCMVVNLINCMYIFLMNNKEVEAGELLPVIIYCLISSCPERITFNVNFMKFFLNEKEYLSQFGYNITQLESSINFIQKLGAKQLNMSQEEFNEKLKSVEYDKRNERNID